MGWARLGLGRRPARGFNVRALFTVDCNVTMVAHRPWAPGDEPDERKGSTPGWRMAFPLDDEPPTPLMHNALRMSQQRKTKSDSSHFVDMQERLTRHA